MKDDVFLSKAEMGERGTATDKCALEKGWLWNLIRKVRKDIIQYLNVILSVLR